MSLFIQFKSPIGLVTVYRARNGIARVEVGSLVSKCEEGSSQDEVLQQCELEFTEYFTGKRKDFNLPLDWSGISSFQADVLHLTLGIPFGEIRTYGEIARALHKPAGSRAVGGALARNPLPILIPCHRVVAASGQLTGYSAANGITTKAWLLEMEGHKIVAQKLA